MRKSIIWLIWILIIVVAIYLNIAYGNYYDTPEGALENREAENTSMQYIIEKVWVNDEPIIFYVNEKNNFSHARFSTKEIRGKTGYRVTVAGRYTLDINSAEVVPIKWNEMIESTVDYYRIMYGITNSEDIYSISINGESPTFKSFEMGGEEYVLWYILGSTELDNPNITLE